MPQWLTDAIKMLFAYIMRNPYWRRTEVMAALGWSDAKFWQVQHGAQLELERRTGGAVNINGVPDPEDPGGCWIYCLTADREIIVPHANNSVDHIVTRLESLHARATTWVRATSGRTMEGRAARTVERETRQTMENLEAMRQAAL